MAEQKDRTNQTEYSVDEILAEYGTGRYAPSKVTEFPEPEQEPVPQPGPDPVVFPTREKDPDEEMAEIRPVSLFHGLAARMHTFLRRADHYADHMYDQAEPDEATLKAERYIPGVDREEIPAQPQRVRRLRRPRVPKPDTPPAELAKRYTKGLKSKRIRGTFALLFSVLCMLVSLDLSFFDWAGASPLPVPLGDLRLMILLELLAGVGGLCFELIGRGVATLFRLRPGAETLLAAAFLFTAADGAALLLTHSREGLPCCAVISFGLTFSLWGDLNHRRGDRLSARAAAQTQNPFAVTLDEGKWSGRAAYAKASGVQTGFGSQLQEDDGVQRAYRVAAPLLLTVCLVCSAFVGTARNSWQDFLWAASSMLTACCGWSALRAYAIPYRKLADRLFQIGAALAGWPGVVRCRTGGILMTDNDLFPTGAVQITNVRLYGDVSDEKAVAYTASLLRALDCGLTRPFHDLLRSHGAFYREVSGFRCHEGGVTGIIRNHEVFVGTASFMHLMDVPLPQGLNVKHAVFCAINGELAALFSLKYAMSQSVRPCLTALMDENVSPVLATRDPNLIPALLGQKFKLPVDKMEFPPVDRRLELSAAEQDHDETPVALLSREGLAPYCDAVVGGIRLRAATRWGIILNLAGSMIGAALTFYLTYVGAVASLTAANFLLFMALWLVPHWLVANWVNQY